MVAGSSNIFLVVYLEQQQKFHQIAKITTKKSVVQCFVENTISSDNQYGTG
jgi:hypothetical protein